MRLKRILEAIERRILRVYNDEKFSDGGMVRKQESKEVEYKKQLVLIFGNPEGQK